ncbi:PilW family protein [Cupriavidus basilensis]
MRRLCRHGIRIWSDTRPKRPRGFSLVELMIGLALGMLAGALAASAFHSVQVAYRAAVDLVLLEERGQRAIAVVSPPDPARRLGGRLVQPPCLTRHRHCPGATIAASPALPRNPPARAAVSTAATRCWCASAAVGARKIPRCPTRP